MTVVDGPSTARLFAAPRRPHRSELDLALQQLQAIDTFNATCRAQEAALEGTARTRELRLDGARARDVLQRQHAALVDRAQAQLLASGSPLRLRSRRRAVLAHRNAWFLGKVQEVLEGSDVDVVALTDNGADAIGILVAEQPDLVMLEDTLVMVPGEEVVRQARRYVPQAVVAVQTAHGDRVGRLLDAGASAVFTRQVPPADLSRSLLDLAPV